MKKWRNNSHHASTLLVALSTGLISISAILLAIAAPTITKKVPRHAAHRFQLKEGADADTVTALGNYPNTSVSLSGDTTVTPDTTPTNTTSINVSTNSNFKGTFAASPATGVVRVTDAHPVGAYTVTVTAFGPQGTTTKSFTLTITSGIPCGPSLTAGFTNAADVITASNPDSVAIGDFNGDEKQDLAVANFSSNTVAIRLGNGVGGFSGSAEVSVGTSPVSIAIGDFDGDGKQDLVVANYNSNTVSIRLGDGLGGFSGSTEVSVGSFPVFVAIGDFNGDGKQDLAVANYGSDGSGTTVSIRLGDGLGGFSGSTEVSVGPGPFWVRIGDFNGDSKQDLAIGNYGTEGSGTTVSIRLGDGVGGFTGSTELNVGTGPSSGTIGDFNGDGKQDLAVADILSNTISIRLGDGLGGFSGSTGVSVGSAPDSVAIGDFNGDGKHDLAVVNDDSNTVSIRLGDGLGGFSGSTEVSVGSSPGSVTIGDFNGDGKQDLAIANFNSNTVSIRLGQCVPVPTPTPTPPSPTPTPAPTPSPCPSVTPATSALNLSTRLQVGTGNNVGIGGFIITGCAPKRVILRGIGPSLAGVGVPNPLADPIMELHVSTFVPVVNDNWRDTQEAVIIATGLAPTNDLESGIVVTLSPGAYTVILRGKNNGTGVGLIETYDLNQAASKLANVSTRGFVGSGSDIMIAGFILGGNDGYENIVVRGIGPSLFVEIGSILTDPKLELRNSSGTLIRSNDNWMDDPTQKALIIAAGLAPTDIRESAIYETLGPGPYTALLSGVNNGTGVGLVEVYDRGAP